MTSGVESRTIGATNRQITSMCGCFVTQKKQCDELTSRIGLALCFLHHHADRMLQETQEQTSHFLSECEPSHPLFSATTMLFACPLHREQLHQQLSFLCHVQTERMKCHEGTNSIILKSRLPTILCYLPNTKVNRREIFF